MIGATFFASPIALATEAEDTKQKKMGPLVRRRPLNKLPDDVLKAIEKAEKEAEANKPAEDEATALRMNSRIETGKPTEETANH